MSKCLNFIVFWVFLSLVSCSSAPKDIRQRVKLGMDKSEVLEILGNPSRSKRVNGADRWDYDQYKDDQKEVTSVYFKSGRVSFVGSDDDMARSLKELSDMKKSDEKSEDSGEFRDL